MKFVLFLLGKGVAWVPALILAALGASYIGSLYWFLMAPGKNLSVPIKTDAGPITLNVGSYSIDPINGAIAGRDISLLDPVKRVIARADSVAIRIDRLKTLSDVATDVDINGLRATLERDVNGEFPLFKYFKQEKTDEKGPPLNVQLRDAQIVFVDHKSRKSFNTLITLPAVNYVASGETWMASGDFKVGTGNAIPFRASGLDQGRFDVVADLNKFEIARLATHFGPELPEPGRSELAKMSAQSVLLSGPLRIQGSEGRDPQIWLAADAQVVALRGPWWNRALTGSLKGDLTASSFTGAFEVADGRSQANFRGALNWTNGFQLNGNLVASMPHLGVLPSEYRKDIPNELAVQGIRFDGRISFADQGGFKAQGRTSASTIRWEQEFATNVVGALTVSDTNLDAIISQATWQGELVDGALQWNRSNDAIKGFAESKSVDLARLARRFKGPDVRGRGSVAVHFGGTAKQPNANLTASGTGSVKWRGKITQLGRFEFGGALKEGVLTLNRGLVSDRGGSAAITGTINLEKKTLDLEGVATGILLERFVDDVSGSVGAELKIKGTFDDFQAQGRVEALGVEVNNQIIPVIVGDIVATERGLRIGNLSAARGASRLDGQIALEFETQKLSGQLSGRGIQLTDWVDEGVSGSVDIQRATLSGTLENPNLVAQISGRQIVAAQIVLDSFSVQAGFNGKTVTAQNATLQIDSGTITADATYNLETKDGSVSGRADAIPLEKTLPVIQGDTLIDGEVSGRFEGKIIDDVFVSGSANGALGGITINKVAFGGGNFSVATNGTEWSGSAEIGQFERYIQVNGAKYNEKLESFAGEVVAYNIPVDDIYKAVRPNLTPATLESKPRAIVVPQDVLIHLARLTGALDLNVRVSGKADDPSVQLSTLAIRDLEVSKEPSGDLKLIAQRAPGGVWTVNELAWLDGPGVLNVSGQLVEEGDVNLTGSLQNFEPQWLGLFSDKFAKLDGRANLNFEATGPIEAPEIVGSLDANLIEVPQAEQRPDGPSTRLNFAIGPFKVSKSGISLDGSFNYQGIGGSITGQLPFTYPVALRTDQPINVELKVSPRDLTALKEFLPESKIQDLVGSFDALVTVGGTYDDVRITGESHLTVERFAAEGMNTEVKNIGIVGTFKDGSVQLDARGEIGAEGKFSTRLSYVVPDLGSGIELSPETFLDNPVSGRVDLRDVAANEKIGLDKSGSVDFSGSGQIYVSGTLREPLLATRIPLAVEKLEMVMPGVFAQNQPGPLPTIRPKFSIGFVVGQPQTPARFRAATASINMNGTGALTGDMVEPKLASNLEVQSGTIRLPNARIALNEGGRVRVGFDGSQQVEPMRVDVDIEGRTALSTLNFAGAVQRYDIELRMRGNLLNEEAVTFTARSDPPELSQAAILNLLGQESLVQSLAGQFTGRRSDSALIQTIAGVALPTLLDPFTQRIATELGLDYLTVEYNAFEGVTLTAAKNLGKGFSLQGRRQVSETLEDRIYYDYRLIYRPRIGGNTLRNLIFSVGSDQDRPYKIAIEYGIRF